MRIPRLKTVLLSIVLLNSLAIIIAIAQSLIFDKTPGYYFRERAFITYISGIQLFIITYITYKIRQIIARNSNLSRQNRRFWTIITVGSLFLAIDEMLEIHERLDELFHYLLAREPTLITDLIDDIIVGSYVIFALIILIKNYQYIKLFKSSFFWFKIGFVLSFSMVFLDIITNNTIILDNFIYNSEQLQSVSSWLSVVEESSKLIAEGMFIVGFCHCWHIVHQLSRLKY